MNPTLTLDMVVERKIPVPDGNCTLWAATPHDTESCNELSFVIYDYQTGLTGLKMKLELYSTYNTYFLYMSY
jgi:hypothetical protein